MGHSSQTEQERSLHTALAAAGYIAEPLPTGEYVLRYLATRSYVARLESGDALRKFVYPHHRRARKVRAQGLGYENSNYRTGKEAQRVRRGLRMPVGWRLLGVLAFADGDGCDGLLEYRTVEARDARGRTRKGRVYENGRGGWEKRVEWEEA